MPERGHWDTDTVPNILEPVWHLILQSLQQDRSDAPESCSELFWIKTTHSHHPGLLPVDLGTQTLDTAATQSPQAPTAKENTQNKLLSIQRIWKTCLSSDDIKSFMVGQHQRSQGEPESI